jgi:hypothetical protein
MRWHQALNLEIVRAWMEEHPRESLAFSCLNDEDELRDEVIEGIISGRDQDPLAQLTRFADALVHRQRCAEAGTLLPPPEVGKRRPHDVWIAGMAKHRLDSGATVFRVDIHARDGWSGYFDTTTPQDVERISKMKDRTQMVVVVGEIIQRPYDCLVVFGDRTRLV